MQFRSIRDRYGVFITCFLVAFVWLAFSQPHDDTDPPDGRSGLGLYRDALTGCEYVSGGPWPAAITPRLNADGTQVCRK